MKKIILFLLLLMIPLIAQEKGYVRLKTGIHFDSSVSGGEHSLAELAQLISKTDLDAAIITDHDNMKVSWGPAPFRKLLKYSISENSVAKYGVKNYFAEIDRMDRYFNDVILIPGIEAVPFYYWDGSPIYENLELRNWHRHLLVFGMRNLDDYQNLPSVPKGFRASCSKDFTSIFKYVSSHIRYYLKLFFMVLGFIISACFIVQKRHKIGMNFHTKRFRFSWLMLIITILLGVSLAVHFPFVPSEYNQYNGDEDIGPYQNLIDYVNSKGGMVYWAHPEVNHTELRPVNVPFFKQTIRIKTDSYADLVYKANNASGFAIFWEGMKQLGYPGGIWDRMLLEYCQGYRETIPMTIGELDFEESNDLNLLTETNTFIFAKEWSRGGVMEALNAGRSYSTRNHFGDNYVLDDFSVWDLKTNQKAFIGETLNLTHLPAIHIKMKAIKNPSQNKVQIFRNGILINQFPLYNQIDEWFVDRSAPQDKTYYYRIMVGESEYKLATNPIFVRKE